MPDAKNLREDLLAGLVKGPRLTAVAGDQESLEAVFVFPPSFVGFAGHFPGNPILPGIVQIMAAAHVAAFERGGTLATVKRCKFLRPVRPDERVRVLVERAPHGQCEAALDVDGEPCAAVAFTLAPNPARA